MHNNSIEVGRFTVSPMTHSDADGQYVASVSIRSGEGRNSTDRVWRFTQRFLSSENALRYAAREGATWARSQ